jgi:hypothetical protein
LGYSCLGFEDFDFFEDFLAVVGVGGEVKVFLVVGDGGGQIALLLSFLFHPPSLPLAQKTSFP